MSSPGPRDEARRKLMGAGIVGVGMLAAWPLMVAARQRATSIGPDPLGPPDEHGLRLPPGFVGRVVARSGHPVAGARSGYRWHAAPDGGACFPTSDGGWIYVSNSELRGGGGGASAIRFDRGGRVVDAYRILEGTTANCAGGATPWGTWLSCEEHREGLVWECDPTGQRRAEPRPALGAFRHEAAAVDRSRGQIYLTEDEPDGRLYRFTTSPSAGRLDLDDGRLEVARVERGRVTWLPVDDPRGRAAPTRHQRPESTAFNGGEGIDLHEGVVYFTTKGDDCVWAHDVKRQTLRVVYDAAAARDARLTGVDNLCVAPSGDLLVAEDGGDMQLMAVTREGALRPLIQIEGHARSEVTGPAFDPSGRRLYVSSQRGAAGHSGDGVTFEVTGPFFG